MQMCQNPNYSEHSKTTLTLCELHQKFKCERKETCRHVHVDPEYLRAQRGKHFEWMQFKADAFGRLPPTKVCLLRPTLEISVAHRQSPLLYQTVVIECIKCFHNDYFSVCCFFLTADFYRPIHLRQNETQMLPLRFKIQTASFVKQIRAFPTKSAQNWSTHLCPLQSYRRGQLALLRVSTLECTEFVGKGN